ncbi:type II toxin-antitoxin system HipA family toxin [bacterium]|nr:type II toxin-antitoxin system HipA family toxin [bacterium]
MATRYSNDTQMITVSLWGKPIGTLSWNPRMQVSTFWFAPAYFQEPYDLAPITYPKDLQSSAIGIPGLREPKIYQGLPPFLADSLPDRWGNTLFDQWFADEGLHEKDKTPLTKLSFIGKRAIGALEFAPVIENGFYENQTVRIDALYEQAKLVEQHLADTTIAHGEPLTRKALMALGTSAGGRQMKAIVSIAPDGSYHSGQTSDDPTYKPCILKFNTPQHALSETEMAYHEMAVAAGIRMMPSRLIEVEGVRHFLTLRFDRRDGRKIFTQTLAAIAPDARSYEDLFRTARTLAVPKPEIDELFRRAAFNVLANNTDDHNKNFSFLMDKDGAWHLAPAYDITFIIDTNGREPEKNRCMPIAGKVTDISEADLIQLGRNNAVRDPAGIIREVRKGIALFVEVARRNGVDAFHIELIAGRLAELNPDLGITVSGQAAFSFTSLDGTQVENVRFERTESGNIHILARIGSRDVKHVVTPKKALYQEILTAGFNTMPDKKKEELARKYLLHEGR